MPGFIEYLKNLARLPKEYKFTSGRNYQFVLLLSSKQEPEENKIYVALDAKKPNKIAYMVKDEMGLVQRGDSIEYKCNDPNQLLNDVELKQQVLQAIEQNVRNKVSKLLDDSKKHIAKAQERHLDELERIFNSFPPAFLIGAKLYEAVDKNLMERLCKELWEILNTTTFTLEEEKMTFTIEPPEHIERIKFIIMIMLESACNDLLDDTGKLKQNEIADCIGVDLKKLSAEEILKPIIGSYVTQLFIGNLSTSLSIKMIETNTVISLGERFCSLQNCIQNMLSKGLSPLLPQHIDAYREKLHSSQIRPLSRPHLFSAKAGIEEKKESNLDLKESDLVAMFKSYLKNEFLMKEGVPENLLIKVNSNQRVDVLCSIIIDAKISPSVVMACMSQAHQEVHPNQRRLSKLCQELYARVQPKAPQPQVVLKKSHPRN